MKMKVIFLNALLVHRYYIYLFNNYYLIFIKYTKCNNILLLIIFQPNEDNSTTIIAFDGNFQLRRLKSAGSDYENRLIDEKFIISEDIFSNWISNHQLSYNNILQVYIISNRLLIQN